MSKRIGILGGTFNPVHNGHIHIAKEAIKTLKLDRVIFVPSFTPPHKKLHGKVTTSDRLEMLRLATADTGKFSVSPYEIKKKGKSYSINTAKHLKRRFGKKTELFFVIGADSLSGLKKWKNIKGLMNIVRFAVVPRPGFAMNAARRGVLKIKAKAVDISSTRIRDLIKRGKSARNSMPDKSYGYLRRKKLYT